MSKFRVLEDIYRHASDLTPAEFRVLVVLMTYTDENCMNAHPSNARLADEVGTDTANVRKRLKRLEELGYVVKTAEGGNKYGHGKANVYRIVVPAQAYARAEELRAKRSGDAAEGEGGQDNPARGFSQPAKVGSHNPPSGHSPGPAPGPELHDDLRSSDHPEGFHDHRSAATPKPPQERGPREVLEAMQAVANTRGGNYSEPYEHFLHALRVNYSPELADYAELRNWTMSPKQRDAYGAQAKLTTLLNTARLEGIDVDGTRYSNAA